MGSVHGSVRGDSEMRGSASARVIARLLTVCAVLIGLLLMHGLPAQACADGTGGMAATAMTGMPASGHSDGTILAAGSVHGKMVGSPAAAGEHGTVCVFTPAPRGIDALLALLLAAIVALVSSPRWPNLGGSHSPISHRAPPPTGADLLTALCVSRT